MVPWMLGVLAAAGRQVLVTDADLATPIDELPWLQAVLDAEPLPLPTGKE